MSNLLRERAYRDGADANAHLEFPLNLVEARGCPDAKLRTRTALFQRRYTEYARDFRA